MTDFIYLIALAIVLLAFISFFKKAFKKLKTIEFKIDFFGKGKS